MTSQSSNDSTQAQLSDSTGPDSPSEQTATNTDDTPSTTDGEAGEAEREQDAQVSLMDVSYEGHTAPEPPEHRVTADTIEHDEFYEKSVGDVIWVDGTEYVVVDRPMTLINPSPLAVVSEDGHQGELVAGKIPNGSSDGVAWRSTLTEKETHEISRSDLLCSYDRLYQLEEESLEHVHRWTPDTDTRECPACDDGRSGDPLRIERQASKAIELRKCTNTDCHFMYRFIRDFPEGDEANIITHDANEDQFGIESVDGVFTCEEQDDFKFPVETNKGRDDGFYTANEIADFVNPKMTGEPLTSLFESDDVTDEELLTALEFVTEEETSYLTPSDEDEETTYRAVESFGELYEEYVADRQIPVTDDILNAVTDASVTDVYRTLVFLRTAIADKPAYSSQNVDDTGLDVDPDVAVTLAVDALTNETLPSRDDVPDTVTDALTDAFTSELTVDSVLSSTVFKELLEGHTEYEPFGVVDVDTNRSGELVVEWRDAAGYDKKMRITFTRIEPTSMDVQQFGWYMERHDLSEIAP